MPKPLESHIAFYRGYEDEEIPLLLPTLESSFFSNPAAVRSADLATIFTVRTLNSKLRGGLMREVTQFCTNATNREIFQTHLRSLITSLDGREGKTPEDLRRSGLYSSVLEDLNRHFPQLEDAEESTSKPSPVLFEILEARSQEPIPPKESPRRVPQKVINLVNTCLSASYPEEFGTLIPPLSHDSIRVFPNGPLTRFLRQMGLHTSHSMKARLGERVSALPNIVEEPSYEVIATMVSIPGRPIYYPEGELTGFIGTGLDPEVLAALKEATSCKTLIHETFHRTPQNLIRSEDAIRISPDDPLFSLAFATERYSILTQSDPKAVEMMNDRLAALEEYARANDPHVVVSGGQATLFCLDDDGKLRSFVESGYDLEEGIAEVLVSPTLPVLFDYLLKTYGGTITDFAEDLLTSTLGQTSQRYQNLFGNAPSYLKSLGLKDHHDILDAHVQSSIPKLHIQHLGDREYFT